MRIHGGEDDELLRWMPEWGICIACENEVAPIFEDDLCDGCLEMRDENIRIQRLESAERKRTRFERAVTRIEARKQELREMREAKRAKEQERAAGWDDMEEDANPLEREKAELRCALDMVARAMCLGCLSRPREGRRMLCPRCLMIGEAAEAGAEGGRARDAEGRADAGEAGRAGPRSGAGSHRMAAYCGRQARRTCGRSGMLEFMVNGAPRNLRAVLQHERANPPADCGIA